MNKRKVFVVLCLVFVLTLVSTTSGAGKGNDPGLTMPPVSGPDTGVYDGHWNVGKTKLSSPFAYNGYQTLWSVSNAPDAGKGKTVFFYIFVGGAPTKVCFPAPGGATTKIHYEHPSTHEWVKPGLKTTTEIHFSTKYRCASVVANGNYGLIGK